MSESAGDVTVRIVFRTGASQLENRVATYRMTTTERDRLIAECAGGHDASHGTYDARYIDPKQPSQPSQPCRLFLCFGDVLYIG